MARAHVKKNDVVMVISGAAKGRTGKVLRIDLEKGRVMVEGTNIRKKAVRRSQSRPQGGIIEVEGPIAISNVMLLEKYNARRAKRGAAPVTHSAEAAAPEEAAKKD